MQQSTSFLQSAHNFSVGNLNVGIHYPQVEDPSSFADAPNIVQWLSNPKINYWIFHNEIKSRRTAGTGLWFLEGELFRRWAAGELKALWVTGIPGSGKTVLASASLEQVQSSPPDASKPPVLFAYCRYVDKCTARDVLCSFLQQLVVHSPAVCSLLKPAYDENRAKQTTLSEPDALQALVATLAQFDDSFAIIDGLDEVADDEKVKLLTILADLPTKVLTFSRPLDLFMELLPMAMRLPLKASDEDIRRFVTNRITTHPRLRRLISQKASLTQFVEEAVLRKSEGMFLLAALQVDALNGCLNLKSLMKTLDSLPSGINEMYQRTMCRISNQSAEEAALAKLTLLWLTHAQRSLKIEELQDALATSFRDGSYDADAITESGVILVTCCGLVTIDESSREVRLIHHTTHEYLQSLESTFPCSDHATVATLTCTTYLIHHGYHERDLQTPDALEAFLSSGPAFIRYAQESWALHARKLTQADHGEACTEVVSFLCRCRPVAYKFPLLNYFNFPYRLNAEYEVLGPCHVVACFGLVELYLNVEGRQELTPRYKWNTLHLSALFDQGAMAALVFREDLEKDVNSTDARGRSALHLAVQEGSSSVVQLLLSHPTVDVNLRDKYGSVPLSLAAEEAQVGALTLLAQHPSIEINARTRLGESPLLQSVQSGRLAVAEVLLGHPSIDVNVDDGMESVLLAAVRRGHVGIVKTLVRQTKVEVNWRPRSRGSTPLSEALSLAGGSRTNPTLPLLLEHPRLDINAKDPSGHTPLTRAVQLENLEVVKLLLRHPSIDPNTEDSEGLTPLIRAINCRLEGMTHVILDHPLTDPNFPCPDGHTPLVIAIARNLTSLFDALVWHKHIEIQYLVPGVTSGQTVCLIHAILRGSRHFTESILHYYSVNRRTLNIAAEDDASFRLLLERGVDLNALVDSELAFLTKFSHPKYTNELDGIIYLRRDVLALTPAGHPKRTSSLKSLTSSLSSKYKQSRSFMVLQETISLIEEMLTVLPTDHTDYLPSRHSLATFLHARFKHTKSIEDLERSISLYRDLLTLYPDVTGPQRLLTLSNLATALSSRFEELQQTEDLHELVSLQREVVRLQNLEAIAGQEQLECLRNLARSLLSLYRRTQSFRDLQESTRLSRLALRLCPTDHPERSSCATDLAQCLSFLFDKCRGPATLEESISLYRDALALRPARHPQRLASLIKLAGVLSKRFEFKQGLPLADLEESIQLYDEAVRLCPHNHPERAPSLHNLGNCWVSLFKQSPSLSALDQSIRYYKATLTLRRRSDSDREQLSSLDSLTNAYLFRHNMTRDVDDLGIAILYLRQALNIIPEANPERQTFLRRLADTLISRFELSEPTGLVEDLEESLALYRELPTSWSISDIVDKYTPRLAYLQRKRARLEPFPDVASG